MKKKLIQLLAIVVCITTIACSESDSLNMQLQASSTQVAIGQEVIFSVMVDGVDVTKDAIIYLGKEKISGNIFISDIEGTYIFTAQYNGEFSNEIKIKVTGESLVFVKNSVWLRFTSSGCSACPTMEPTAKEMKERFEGRVSTLVFHSDYGVEVHGIVDPYALPDAGHYQWWSNAIGGLPNGAVDCDIPFIQGSPMSLITRRLNTTPKVGLSMQTEVKDGKMTIITKGKFAENLDSYREIALAIWITESNLVSNQLNGALLVQDYVNYDVVRERVTPMSDYTVGQVIEPTKCMKGNEVVYTYSIDVSKYKIENTKVVAYIYTNDGVNVDSANGRLVQNSIEVKAGESKGYQILN